MVFNIFLSSSPVFLQNRVDNTVCGTLYVKPITHADVQFSIGIERLKKT